MPTSAEHRVSGVDALEHRIRRFRRRVRMALVVRGVCELIVWLTCVVLLTLVLDRWLGLSVGVRVTALLLAVGGMAAMAYLTVLRPTARRMDPVDLVFATHREDPRIAERVATVLQMPRLQKHHHASAASLAEEAVRRNIAALETVDFGASLDRRKLVNFALLAVVMLGLLFAWWRIDTAVASLWYRRWVLASREPWPQRTYLDVPEAADGRIIVPRGEPYSLRVVVARGSEEPDEVRYRARQGPGVSWRGVLTRSAEGEFKLDLPAVVETLDVRLRGGDDRVGPITLDPRDRPRIRDLSLTASHPLTGAEQLQTFRDVDTDPAFLEQTRLRLLITATRDISEATLTTTGAGPTKLVRRTARTFEAAWIHHETTELAVELRTADGLTSLPAPIVIRLKPDRAPRVSLTRKAVRERVTPQAAIPLTVLARDDYGIDHMQLLWTLTSLTDDTGVREDSGARSLYHASGTNRATDVSAAPLLNVAGLQGAAGDVLRVRGLGTDACVTGVQTGASPWISFAVVPPQELFREILLRHQRLRGELRRAADKAGEIAAVLGAEEASARADEMLHAHRLVQRQVGRISAALTDSLAEMRQNRIGNAESHELMEQRILAPLHGLHTDAMVRQTAWLEAWRRDETGTDTAGGAAAEEEIVQTMREVLKEMSEWESFIDVVNQLAEVIELETRIMKTTRELKEDAVESLFED